MTVEQIITLLEICDPKAEVLIETRRGRSLYYVGDVSQDEDGHVLIIAE